MDRKVIPLKVPGAQWTQLTEFDQHVKSIAQCMEFLQLTAETLLAECERPSGRQTLSRKEKDFYAVELPLVKGDVEDALAQLQTLLGRVDSSDVEERPSA